MICHKHKFIFVHIPKCAGTSIESMYNVWSDKNTEEKYYVGKHRQHYFLDTILKTHPECTDYYKFTFVRNPYSRILSEYTYIKKTMHNGAHFASDQKFDLTFKDFCLDLTNNMKKYCYPYHETRAIDYFTGTKFNYVGRMENLQRDFSIICKHIGLPVRSVPHVNETRHEHYTEYYDDQTREIVAKHYAEDINFFGYEFGE